MPLESMAKPTLGILILNRNGQKWLGPLYDSLLADGYENKRLYLVDNASRDGSIAMTLDQYPEVFILRMPKNLGYSIAYNLALPYALADGCEYIIWSNNDIRVEPGCLSKLITAMERDPDIGILGPALLSWENDEPHPFIVGNCPWAVSFIKAQSSNPLEIDWVEGSFPMVRRRCLEMIGSFDPYLYLGWEDADLCRRARRHGWRVMLLPNALVHHYGGGYIYADRPRAKENNRLRTKNYYIYQLTNPFQPFTQNLMRAFHAFFVNLKNKRQAFSPSVGRHIHIFLLILFDLMAIYKKWKRDDAGIPPPMQTPRHPPIRVEIVRELGKAV